MCKVTHSVKRPKMVLEGDFRVGSGDVGKGILLISGMELGDSGAVAVKPSRESRIGCYNDHFRITILISRHIVDAHHVLVSFSVRLLLNEILVRKDAHFLSKSLQEGKYSIFLLSENGQQLCLSLFGSIIELTVNCNESLLKPLYPISKGLVHEQILVLAVII